MLVRFHSITHHLQLLPRLEGCWTLCKYIYTQLLARFWTAWQRNMLSCSCTAHRWNKRMHGNKSTIYKLVRDTREYSSKVSPRSSSTRNKSTTKRHRTAVIYKMNWPTTRKMSYICPTIGENHQTRGKEHVRTDILAIGTIWTMQLHWFLIGHSGTAPASLQG
jgi:hypothetical protein